VKTDRDERLWAEAKKQAKEQGKGDDYAYVMGIFQRMKNRKGGAKEAGFYRVLEAAGIKTASQGWQARQAPAQSGTANNMLRSMAQNNPVAALGKAMGGGAGAGIRQGMQRMQTPAGQQQTGRSLNNFFGGGAGALLNKFTGN
jgi:hypothetical protein